MGRYDRERPWHSWADMRFTMRPFVWHWSWRPRVYRDAGSLSTFEWLFLTVEYWTWDRRGKAFPPARCPECSGSGVEVDTFGEVIGPCVCKISAPVRGSEQ